MLHQLTRLWISPVLLFLIVLVAAFIAFEMVYQPENIESALQFARQYLDGATPEEP